jgi:predicted transcriptional regulator
MEDKIDDVENMSEEDFDREFAVGKKVKLKVDLKGSILSIRMDRSMFKRLEEYAHKTGLGITVAARELIDEGLKRHENESDALADLLEEAASKLRSFHP